MSQSPLSVRLQIPSTHPMFAGHFPGHPVVPGAWLMAQAIRAFEAAAGESFDWHDVVSAKFHAAVLPGARLDLELTPIGTGGWQLVITGECGPMASVRFGGVKG